MCPVVWCPSQDISPFVLLSCTQSTLAPRHSPAHATGRQQWLCPWTLIVTRVGACWKIISNAPPTNTRPTCAIIIIPAGCQHPPNPQSVSQSVGHIPEKKNDATVRTQGTRNAALTRTHAHTRSRKDRESNQPN